MNVKHIFFDLDHTLWDFDKNSALTFQQIFEEQNIRIDISEFLLIYMPINLRYWKLYREDKVSKTNLRFGRLKDTFDALKFQISNDLIIKISEYYIKYLPNHNHLFEGAVEVLEYLKQKYELHIITNGFEEIQSLKMQKSGIDKFFKEVITSESVGVKKPNPKVFEFALRKAETIPEEAIMIGDSYEADILGALNCGMSAIHFTSDVKPNSEVINIKKLISLKDYL